MDTRQDLEQFSIPEDNVAKTLDFPCSLAQQRCWIVDQLSPGTTTLNVVIKWEVRGPMTPALAEEAFHIIIRRHEILRTSFFDQNGEPRQRVSPAAGFKLSYEDLSRFSEAERQQQLSMLERREVSKPIAMTEPPLLRVTHIQMDDHTAFLLIMIHQACFDGWSIRLLGREFGETLQALHENRNPVLPELPLQYGDYASWQKECLTTSAFEDEAKYWTHQLESAPYFEISPDPVIPGSQGDAAHFVTELLPAETGRKLDELASSSEVSQFTLGTAILSTMFHRYTSEKDILIGTQVSGRDETDLENLIGVFINNLVLRLKTIPDVTFREHLAHANETVRNALIYQRMPFQKLVEILRPVRDVTRPPLISINFIQQRAFLEDAGYGAFKLAGKPSPSPASIYDLNLIMVGRPEGWRMTIDYNQNRFTRNTATELLKLWHQTIEFAANNPGATLSEFPSAGSRSLMNAEMTLRLSRIEQALRENAEIGDAAVIRRRTPDGASGVFAYITPSPDTYEPLETLPGKLLRRLEQIVPSGQLPDGISVLLRLPKTTKGLLDEAALPAPRLRKPAAPTDAVSSDTQDSFEAKIRDIWQGILEIPDVRPGDNFFALGGHSLLALRMLSQVRAKLNVQADLAGLFSAPTPRELAALLASQKTLTAPPQSSIWQKVILSRGAGGLPIISFNHPVLFHNLTQALGEQSPSLNFQMLEPQHLERLSGRDFRQIVRECVELIVEARLPGPYVLCGLCVNGLVAFEAAQQLRKLGHDVRLVVMVDTWAPGHAASLPVRRRRSRRLQFPIAKFQRNFNMLRNKKISLKEFLYTYSLTHKIAGLLNYKKTSTDEDDINRLVADFLVSAGKTYRTAASEGDVLLIRTEATPKGAIFDEQFGWRPLVKGNIEVVDYEGWHEQALRLPTVKQVGKVIAGRLRMVAAHPAE